MLTKADQLRLNLDRLEADLGKLGFGLGKQALEIPALMDEISQQFEELDRGGFDLPEEKLRWETALSQARAKARLWVREVGGMAAAAEARRKVQPEPARWWWFLDEQVVQSQKAALRRFLGWAVGAVVLLILLGVLYQVFLAPDPETQARVAYVYDAERLARDGKLADALLLVEKALALAPDDPELLVFHGVLQYELGQVSSAEKDFQRAQQVLKDPEAFYLSRGQRFFSVGNYQQMLADAQAALQVNAQSAAGYMLLGQAQEALGQYAEALDSYERASELAEAQNRPEIAVTSRMLYGNLLQRQAVPTIEVPASEEEP